jgi:hypothetical protein
MGLSALILEPNYGARCRFQEIAQANTAFSRCVASSSLSEGGERLRNGFDCDMVYVSSRFDPIVVSQFIISSRKVSSRQDRAHLVVIARNSNETPVRQFELGKPDGYLLEPLLPRDLDGSVDFVKSMQKTYASKEKEVSSHAPSTTNIKTLCARMALAIDRGKPGLKDLQELSRKVELLSEAQKTQYYEELVKYMTEFRKPGGRYPGK